VKEVALAYLKIPPLYSPGETEEDHKNISSLHETRPRLELMSRMQVIRLVGVLLLLNLVLGEIFILRNGDTFR